MHFLIFILLKQKILKVLFYLFIYLFIYLNNLTEITIIHLQ